MSKANDRDVAEVVSLPVEEAEHEGADEGESLDQLRDALEGLRREIRCRFPQRVQSGAKIDWMPLFQDLRRRLSTLGMAERSAVVDEFGMDEVVLQRSRRPLDFLFERYWRIEVVGLENIPAEGPELLVANRSGLLPYDGLMVAHALERWRPRAQRPRFLVADWLITLPFVQPYLARLGGVRACRENADRLLRRGSSVIAFPEGAKGATKAFRDRYRMMRFGRGGVVRTALENEVPLVPVGIVGPEEAHPILFKWRLGGRAVGLPFLPVTPTFPVLGPLGLLPLPTKWLICFGEPIDVEACGAEAARDEILVSRLTEELRQRVEALVSRGLELRPSVWA
ncbi:MAG: lysophospholipid acyltransferase family protein [Myxococcota bacterium]